MKKTIFTIVFLLLFLIALFLTSCRESDHHESDYGGNSGNDYGDNSGNGSNNDWYTPSSPVSIITRTYLTKQKQGEQLSTDKFYEGEDVFLRLVLQATNSANITQNVSLTITIENATYLDAYNEETGNVKPEIKQTSQLGASTVITISGIHFSLDSNQTKTREYIFRIRPKQSCQGQIITQYTGNVSYDDATHYQAYTFEKRTNFDKIDAPEITFSNDGFVWTESPLSDTDKKLYIVELFDANDNRIHFEEAYTKNSFKLSNVTGLTEGTYRLEVITRGDAITTKDSNAQSIEFTYVNPTKLELNNGVLTWTAIKDAPKYRISFGDFAEYVTDTEFDLTWNYDGVIGDVTIQVIPVFENNTLSTYSNAIQTKIIETPEVSISGAYASWNQIEGATYDIYINGEYKETVTETRYRRIVGENIKLVVVAKFSDCVALPSNEVDISTD